MDKDKLRKRLKEEREKRQLTQDDIAKIIHLKRESYTKYETGTNIPTLESISIIAQYYKLSVDYLIGLKD